MTTDTIETKIIRPGGLKMPPDLALRMYRQSMPLVSVAGLCYATPDYAQLLGQGNIPYQPGFHLTLVEAIEAAAKSAYKHHYDFILMAGPRETQLQDVLYVAKAQFFSRNESPLYVLGEMHPKTAGLLKILGLPYGLQDIPAIHDIAEIKEINGV